MYAIKFVFTGVNFKLYDVQFPERDEGLVTKDNWSETLNAWLQHVSHLCVWVSLKMNPLKCQKWIIERESSVIIYDFLDIVFTCLH